MWRHRVRVLALAGIFPFFCPASPGDVVSVAVTDAVPSLHFDVRFLGPEARTGLSDWNNDVVEDPQGNVYMASEQLLRFDGVRWEVITTPGLFDPVSLAFDAGGRLWVGGVGEIGFIEADAAGVPRFTLMTEKVGDHAFEQVWRIFVDGSNVVFVTKDSVFRWNGRDFRVWTFGNTQRLLGFRFEGAVYIHARGDGLFRFNGEEWTRIAGDTLPEGTGIIGMHRRRDGSVLCLTTQYLYLFEGGGFRRLPTGFDSWLEADYPVVAASFGEGMIAFGTIRGGLLVIDESGMLLDRMTRMQGRKISQVISVGPSSNGGVWAGFRSGLLRIRPSGSSRFYFPAGVEQGYVQDMTLHGDRIYAATSGGLLRASRNGQPGDGFHLVSPNQVWSVTSRGGDLLSGNLGSIIVYRDEAVAQAIETVRSDTNYTFPGLFDTDIVYVGTPERFRELRRGNGSWVSGDPVHFKGSPSSLAEVAAGILYIGTGQNGLFLATRDDRPDSGWTLAPSGNPQFDDGFVCVHRAGGQLLALSRNGLFRATVDDPTFRHDPLLGDAIGENVYMVDMVGDFETGGVYVSLQEDNPLSRQPTRIGRITMDERERFQWEELYLPGIEQAGGVAKLLFEDGPDGGRLWVGGKACILRYDLDRYEPPALPRASLRRVRTVAGDDTLWGGFGRVWPGFDWDFSRRSLHFDFAAPGNLDTELRFQSRLAGLEKDWTAPSDSGFREITNLHEGHYTLQVRAVDSFGRAGPVAAYDFTVRPPWYRTTGAYGGYALLAVAAVGGFVRWRTGRLRRQTEELEAMVKDRTEELEQRNIELIEANNVKEDFLAHMSHEIRNPLNGILGIARLLKERGTKGGGARAVDHLDSCATHLNQLLTEVLDYARLESGRMELRAHRFQPMRVLEEVRMMHENMAAGKGLDLRLEVPEKPSFWLGDPVFLRQILINLVSNAIKYTAAGGVTVRFTFREADGRAEARFEVEDTGPGIPPDMQAKVFEKFTRLARAGESEVSGTGLGLAIAAEMARFLGGTIELQSEVGRGSTFVLAVPFELAEDDAEDEATITDTGAAAVLAGQRVLVVDDLDFNRFIARELLEHFGARVEEAADGNAALKAMEAGSYDLVLMDINMPGRNGLWVASAWRAGHPPRDGPLLVALSAYVSDEMVNRALGSGFDHFLEKPLDPAALLALLPQTSGTEATPTHKNLLDFLGDGSADSRKQVHERYRRTLSELAQEILETVAAGDGEASRQTLHKFLGLANLDRDPAVLTAASSLREHLLRTDWDAVRAGAEQLAALVRQT